MLACFCIISMKNCAQFISILLSKTHNKRIFISLRRACFTDPASINLVNAYWSIGYSTLNFLEVNLEATGMLDGSFHIAINAAVLSKPANAWEFEHNAVPSCFNLIAASQTWGVISMFFFANMHVRIPSTIFTFMHFLVYILFLFVKLGYFACLLTSHMFFVNVYRHLSLFIAFIVTIIIGYF